MSRIVTLALPLLLVAGASPARMAAQDGPSEKPMAPLDFLIGRWEGSSEGQPGNAQVRREYTRVLNDKFIRVQNQSTYKPQQKNPEGEVHEDVGMFSNVRL